ncbi:MAG TPA: DUF4142 domain-containing protein [Gemmatimonadaceae bacterium]|nr:DUF4142 domain-containing protein [Gemmatimonadaceae bacterium]
MRARIAGRLGAVVSTVAIFGLLACQPGDDDVAVSDTGVAVTTDTGVGAGTTGTGDTMVATGALRREYTNENIVGFLTAANAAEIESGQAAQNMATNAQVREYARTIERDHSAARDRLSNLARQLNIQGATLPQDDDLVEDHNEAMQDLRGKAKGADWDKAFIDHQIDAHQKVIDEVEDAIEATENAQLKTELQNMLPNLRAHLQQAERIKEQLD